MSCAAPFHVSRSLFILILRSPKNLISKRFMLYQPESSYDHEKSGDREGFELFPDRKSVV